MKKIIVVGGGIGGLCTTVRLLKKGYDVTLIEKEKNLGGKVNKISQQGYQFDLTASIIMTPEIYTDLFMSVDKSYKDYIQMDKITPMYKVFYSDNSEYHFYSELDKMLEVLDKMEKDLSTQYLEFLTKSLRKYLVTKEYVLDKDMLNINQILNTQTLRELLYIKPLDTTNKYLTDIIKNKKLKEYLIFQSMYIGIDPYHNSNLYTLIPAISHAYGLYYMKGGMYAYIEALKKLIIDLGGEIILNKGVKEIVTEDNKVTGVRVEGTSYSCDKVVCNADFPYAIKNLLTESVEEGRYNNKNIDSKDYSCSVFMIYLGLNKKYDNLEVHNIYINNDLKLSMEQCFTGNLPENPSFYMYYPSKIDDGLCDTNKSVLNIMVRVPNLKHNNIDWNNDLIKEYRNKIISIMRGMNGLSDIESHIEYESYLTPVDFKEKYNAYNGSAFGLSHNLKQVGYFRPHMKSNNIEGLYYIGSSTHPGNGVSVIIEGSKVLENIIENDDKSI